MNFFAGKSILIISTENWNHVSISKHHYAKSLSHIGAKVFFLNPPAKQNDIMVAAPNLTIVNYKTIKGINSLPYILRDVLNRALIKKIINLCKSRFNIIWSFDPYRFQNLNLFNASLKIYHPVDAHTFKLEHQTAASADLILSVSNLLLEKFNSFNAVKVKVSHGLPSFFLTHPPVTATQAKTVGYVGNIESRSIDTQTLIQIVDENPITQFIFIGPYRVESALSEGLLKKPNCKLLGQIESEKLPGYFSHIDFFLICYDGKNTIQNSNSHKVLEFLSTGKPIVMNYTDEYVDKKDLVIMAEKNEELPGLFKTVVTNYSKYVEPERVIKRMEFALKNTYSAHVEKIAQLAEHVMNQKL